jgi:hypothetical protein
MTIQTTLDETAYYHALTIQNEVCGKRSLAVLRVILIAAVLLVTWRMDFIDENTDWMIRAILCVIVVIVQAAVARQTRRKMLTRTAQEIEQQNGGDLQMEYRFEEDSVTAVGPADQEEIAYSRISALAADTEVLVLVVDRRAVQIIRKKDLTAEDRRALEKMLSAKTKKEWQAVKV